MPKTRQCRKCGKRRAMSKFYFDARFKGGIDIHCCSCRKAKVLKWRLANLDKVRAMKKLSHAANPEPNRKRANNWHLKNRLKHLEYMANRRKNNPRAVRSSRLKSAFGITLEQYEALAAVQKHKCAICDVPQVEQRKKMAVDHNHDTGKIRALLCHNCNVGLGNFKDNEQILTKAIQYLYVHRNDQAKQSTETSNDNERAVRASTDGGTMPR